MNSREFTDKELKALQGKMGLAVSSLAETHTLPILQTVESIYAEKPDVSHASLEVILKVKVNRWQDGKIDIKPSIAYKQVKDTKDELDKMILFDPNPDLFDPTAPDAGNAERDAAAFDAEMERMRNLGKGEIIEAEIVDESRRLPAAPESETETGSKEPPPEPNESRDFYRKRFEAALCEGDKSLTKAEIKLYYKDILGYGDIPLETIKAVISDPEARLGFLAHITTELYSGKKKTGGRAKKDDKEFMAREAMPMDSGDDE